MRSVPGAMSGHCKVGSTTTTSGSNALTAWKNAAHSSGGSGSRPGVSATASSISTSVTLPVAAERAGCTLAVSQSKNARSTPASAPSGWRLSRASSSPARATTSRNQEAERDTTAQDLRFKDQDSRKIAGGETCFRQADDFPTRKLSQKCLFKSQVKQVKQTAQ